MSKIIRVDDNRFAVEGDMQVNDALGLREQGEAMLGSLASPVTVDLKGALNVGSVGVSVLMCWIRKAEQLGKKLVVVNMPDKMYDVSRVSGLDELLRAK